MKLSLAFAVPVFLLLCACRSLLQERAAVDIRVVPLEYAVAAEAVLVLRELVGQDSTLKIVEHAESNAVLLSGQPSEIERALELIANLDVPSTAKGVAPRVLGDPAAEDLREALVAFLGEEGLGENGGPGTCASR